MSDLKCVKKGFGDISLTYTSAEIKGPRRVCALCYSEKKVVLTQKYTKQQNTVFCV